jgi:hypothetical protein
MSSRFEPHQSDCDAPPYHTVQACEGGFESPLDVRWSRMSHFLARPVDQSGMFGLGAWEWLFGRKPPPVKTCACGGPLPALEHYTFTFRSERQAHYLLGQCRRCHTIYWEQEHQLA